MGLVKLMLAVGVAFAGSNVFAPAAVDAGGGNDDRGGKITYIYCEIGSCYQDAYDRAN